MSPSHRLDISAGASESLIFRDCQQNPRLQPEFIRTGLADLSVFQVVFLQAFQCVLVHFFRTFGRGTASFLNSSLFFQIRRSASHGLRAVPLANILLILVPDYCQNELPQKQVLSFFIAIHFHLHFSLYSSEISLPKMYFTALMKQTIL